MKGKNIILILIRNRCTMFFLSVVGINETCTFAYIALKAQ